MDDGQRVGDSHNPRRGGDYYIGLHCGDGTSLTPYTISCDFLEINDLNEPNDTLETATPITSGDTVTAYRWRSLEQSSIVFGDVDWYSFTLTGSGTTTITFEGWEPDFDWELDYDWFCIYLLSDGADPRQVVREDRPGAEFSGNSVSYTHLRAHET